MFKFFKRIRRRLAEEGRLTNYLFYALGEIILVVVGILIALQINNWNIQRMEENQMQDFARALVQDIRADIEEIEIRQNQMDRIVKRMDSVISLVNQRELNELNNLDVLCLTWNLYYRPFKWNRKTLEQLKSSASLRLIDNDSLLKLIGDYDALSRHLDEDFKGDQERVKQMEQSILNVVNMNYSNIKDMRIGLFRAISNEAEEDFHFFTHPEFLEAQEQSIPLLSRDKKDLDLMINNLISLQFQYEIRANVEMKSLKRDANLLINMLSHVYKLDVK